MNTSFERVTEGKDEWLTPPKLINLLGPFDLDPCAPVHRPWPTAYNHYTILDNGLIKDWNGLVWCNPPYGSQAGAWLRRCSEHNSCIALTFARTETKMFHQFVFPKAHSILFLKGRLRFFHVDGTEADNSSGAPSCLIAYGTIAHERLYANRHGIEGHLVIL